MAAAKDLGPGQLLAKYGVVCYQRRRIVGYPAYIFEALGITSAWGLYGMQPGIEQEVKYRKAYFLKVCQLFLSPIFIIKLFFILDCKGSN